MQNLVFKSAFARYFLCYGPEGINLRFDKYGNVVLITGINKDNITDGDEEPSNGSGKSSILDILTFALTGKISKEPTKMNLADLIHDKYPDKQAEVVVEFDNVRIERKINPTEIKIFEDGVNVTPGGKGEPQKWIDKKIGLNYITWCQTCIFSDSNTEAFLELPTPAKRDLIENLLGLEKYRDYHKNAKDMLAVAKDLVADHTKEYERLQNDIDAADKRILQAQQQEVAWKTQKLTDERNIYSKLTAKQQELAAFGIDSAMKAWEADQEKARALADTLATAAERRQTVDTMIKEAEAKIESNKAARSEIVAQATQANLELTKLRSEFKSARARIEQLATLEKGQKCDVCHGVISESNYGHVLKHDEELQDKLNPQILELEELIASLDDKKTKRNELIKKLEDHVKLTKPKLDAFDKKVASDQTELNRLIQIRKPDASSGQRILEVEIKNLQEQITKKQEEIAGPSPYVQIIATALKDKEDKVAECDAQAIELRKAETEVPFYDYWVKAFGDKGIRRFVVDGIIPALNSRIAYWLQYLIGGKIIVEFDKDLEVKITRNGTDAHYPAGSNGEKRRINLAVSQAFAYVMMLNAGRCPSVVFLDEVTGGGIDIAGVTGVYNMIFELAKERQVFVTTHNQKLLAMLDGCQKLTLVKENDVSTLLE
jgi:DNA repair exonuclease SbcCD ATPase subunit